MCISCTAIARSPLVAHSQPETTERRKPKNTTQAAARKSDKPQKGRERTGGHSSSTSSSRAATSTAKTRASDDAFAFTPSPPALDDHEISSLSLSASPDSLFDSPADSVAVEPQAAPSWHREAASLLFKLADHRHLLFLVVSCADLATDTQSHSWLSMAGLS